MEADSVGWPTVWYRQAAVGWAAWLSPSAEDAVSDEDPETASLSEPAAETAANFGKIGARPDRARCACIRASVNRA